MNIKAILMERDGLAPVNYSTISKKSNSMDYRISKRLFEIVVSKCNRSFRRILKLDKDIIAIDSTTISAGKGRLKWAKYKSQKAEIRFMCLLMLIVINHKKLKRLMLINMMDLLEKKL